MDELNLAFNEYISEYKKLDKNEKRMEAIDSIKEIGVLVAALAEKENKQLEFLRSREISELNNGLESEDDFLEALMVYIENSKNLLAQYLSDKV